ncbi:FecR family protein [Pedobacter nyackensis]|uniref:FecR family protein n=1 Tax=Pedobacter nyackensis TaxID=475255 RepID=A0A1W2AP45_9SPHI|nr:FecR family protein [Pedobacter nyackensis]SMC62300.1 FecR family protein [Pedobacter nyackensis]
MSSKHNQYTKEDFMSDKFFLEYVKYASLESVAYWESWVASAPENLAEMQAAKMEIRFLLSAKRIEIPSAIREEVWDAIKNKCDEADNSVPEVTNQPKIRTLWQSIGRIAVAAAILVGIGTSIYLYQHHTESIVNNNQVAADVAPGGNKAMLTLADGKKVILDHAQNGLLAQQGSIMVNKTADGQLTYQGANGKNGAKVMMNKLEVPRAGQYQLTLPDGTKVWLNAASTLIYPAVFTGNERKVTLIGEAYFEVAKNKALPFRVISHNQVVEVLGTHFNIKAYTDDAVTKTTLLEGAVKVSQLRTHNSKLLQPGQQSLLQSSTYSLSVQQADIEQAMGWKNGDFIFKKESLTEIMKALNRWYDIEVEYQGNVKTDQTYSGSISRSMNLSAVLERLESTGQIKFKITGKKITVLE